MSKHRSQNQGGKECRAQRVPWLSQELSRAGWSSTPAIRPGNVETAWSHKVTRELSPSGHADWGYLRQDNFRDARSLPCSYDPSRNTQISTKPIFSTCNLGKSPEKSDTVAHHSPTWFLSSLDFGMRLSYLVWTNGGQLNVSTPHLSQRYGLCVSVIERRLLSFPQTRERVRDWERERERDRDRDRYRGRGGERGEQRRTERRNREEQREGQAWEQEAGRSRGGFEEPAGSWWVVTDPCRRMCKLCRQRCGRRNHWGHRHRIAAVFGGIGSSFWLCLWASARVRPGKLWRATPRGDAQGHACVCVMMSPEVSVSGLGVESIIWHQLEVNFFTFLTSFWPFLTSLQHPFLTNWIWTSHKPYQHQINPDIPAPTNKVRTLFSPPNKCVAKTAVQVELDKTCRSTDTNKTKHSDNHPDKHTDTHTHTHTPQQ